MKYTQTSPDVGCTEVLSIGSQSISKYLPLYPIGSLFHQKTFSTSCAFPVLSENGRLPRNWESIGVHNLQKT